MSINPSSTPIVFIHGSGDSARIWRLQVEHLGPQRAFAIDLPGHGKRPDSLPPEVSVQDYARIAREIVRDELRLTQPIIAGHSLGGAIALQMGLDYGDELSGLILIGTGARLRVHPDLLEGARSGSEVSSRQLTLLAVPPENAASVPEQLMREGPQSEQHMLYRDLSACNVFDCMARLSEIHLPTLIICGTDDRLTPPKYSQYMHDHIAGSTLRILPHAGHYVMREQPDAVNTAIDEFLTNP
jgi:pimeloyl-ACP methyl ester carboxylesterase